MTESAETKNGRLECLPFRFFKGDSIQAAITDSKARQVFCVWLSSKDADKPHHAQAQRLAVDIAW
jgi:hypothetical protein